MRRYILITCMAVMSFALAACDFGQVEQGRTIAFDKNAGTVTFVQDTKHDQKSPSYTGNVLTFKIPTNPTEMGPEPYPGGRLLLDVEKKSVSIYNPETKTIQNIAIEPLDVQKDVRDKSPLLKDKTFPIIDTAQNTVTVYSSRQRMLITFKVPAECLKLPPQTWLAGDEIRIYYKTPGVALRLMNVTRTNIYKR